MAQPRNWYSNIKLLFLILFVLLFLGFAFRDIRAGDISSPLIFLGFLVVIALVFRPWRTGSDEGTTPKKKPPSDGGLSGGQDVRKPPSSYLLAPLLMQDTTAIVDTCDGWVSCHPIATGVIALVVVCLFVGIAVINRETHP